MKLKEIYLSEIATIDVKKCDNYSVVNHQELINSENAFCQYLEQEADEYFGHTKFREWPKEIKKKLESVKLYLKGDILELGSGSCKTSTYISKSPEVCTLSCVEFSETMLTQIAPRVVIHFGGELQKFRFIVGDMNNVSNFNDKKYDAIVLHLAVHHIFLPYFQVEQWHQILNPGGVVICFDEPALPMICPPTRQIKTWINNQIEHQRMGNNENCYHVKSYIDFFTRFKKFECKLLSSKSGLVNKILEKLKRFVWFKKVNLYIVATKLESKPKN